MGMKIISRPASWARHGLRVKAAIRRIAIFSCTKFIQRPRLHCRIRPVVRKRPHNAVTRPAVGAVDIRIKIARIRGIEELFQAIVANRQIRRNANRRRFAALAVPNREFV